METIFMGGVFPLFLLGRRAQGIGHRAEGTISNFEIQDFQTTTSYNK